MLTPGMYEGFRLPDGRMPKRVAGNAVQRENDWLNDETYLSYMWRLYDLAVSVFEWKNLPKGVNERMVERWLLANGMCLFVYDEAIKEDPEQRSPEGYAMLRMVMAGPFDIYNVPKERWAYTVDPNHATMKFDITNSVICFNDNIGTPTFLQLDLYAKMLWQCERSVYTNIAQQKTPRIVKCSEKQRLSLQNLFAQVDGFMPVCWADKDLDLTGVDVLDTVSPYVADKIQVVKHQIWNEALTYLGIENTNTDKKERMVSPEVMGNMGDVEAQRFTRLNSRKQFCKEVNEMFGLDIDVDFRSGMYIRTDKEGTVPVGGMKSVTVDKGGNTGYGGGNLWQALKAALKGGR